MAEHTNYTADELPIVTGRMPTTLAEFEHRCKIHINELQESVSSDNALLSTLCDAIRLSREYAEQRDIRATIAERDETITCLKTQMAELKANEQRHVLAYASQNATICKTLGRALGYIEPDGSVNVCDHTAETLAEEAAKKIGEFKAKNAELGG